jgi:thiamine kinase
MNPRERAARALGLPLRAVEFVRTLDAGSTNASFLMRAGGMPVVVRVGRADPAQLGIERASEAAVLTAVGPAGLGPQVLYSDPATGFLITRRLDGRPWRHEDVHAPEGPGRLGEWFARLHALPRPDGVRSIALTHYITALEQRVLTALPDPVQAQAEQVVSRFGERLAALCHNDVHAGNIFDDGALTLIDWEYAAIGDVDFDLAAPACYHRLDRHERRRMLDGYAAFARDIDVERMPLACWLFDYVACLWELAAAPHASQPVTPVAGMQQTVSDRFQSLARVFAETIAHGSRPSCWWD